jgi:transcriptional regulator with XRE-family HTH domain
MASRNAVPAEDLERFRIALKDAIAGSSLRSVARAVGMSPTGLTKFLNGTQPYGPTVERLRWWYYSKAGVHQIPPTEIAALLRKFVATLPRPDSGVTNVLAAVEASYREAEMFPPEWVQEVRSLVSSPGSAAP